MIYKDENNISPFDKYGIQPIKELNYSITRKRIISFIDKPGKNIVFSIANNNHLNMNVTSSGSFNMEHYIFKRYKKKV